MSRGNVKTKDARMVALWIPKLMLAALDNGVRLTDTDRSKFIRTALREKLQRDNILTKQS